MEPHMILGNDKLLSPRSLALGGIIAALYTGLTFLLAPISYGMFQFRVAEALCILPMFTPGAIPGLFVGCLLANLLGPYGAWDVVLGSLATLISAVLTYKLRSRPLLALWPPVIINAIIIGGMLSVMLETPFPLMFATLFAEQTGACVVLGRLLYMALAAFLRRYPASR